MSVIGHATLNVVPSTKNFGKDLQGMVGAPGEAGGKTLGASLVSGVGGVMKAGLMAVAAPAIAGVSAAVGTAVVGGFARALKIDEATTKLKALGYEGEGVRSIMDSALASVKGTAFGLDSAVTASAGALAAGVKQGEDLTKYLTTVSNTAALAGTSMDDMGGIFNKVMANGKVTTEEMNQLADRGVPIWSYLSNALGVSNDELRKMIETGKVTADMFVGALGPAVDGVAAKMGTSFKGTMSNAVAALSRFGALFAGPVLALVQPWLIAMTAGVDALSSAVKPLTDRFGAWADTVRAAFIATADAEGMWAAVQQMLANLGAGVASFFQGDFLAQFIGGGAALRDGLISSVAEAIPTALPLIVGALSTLGPAMIAALADSFASLIGTVASVLPSVVAAVLSAVPLMIQAGISLFQALIDAAGTILPAVIGAALGMVPAIVETLIASVPLLIDAAMQLFSALVTGLTTAIPLVIGAILNMLPTLIETLISLLPLLAAGALQLFMGLVQGLAEAIPVILQAVLLLLPQLVSTLLGMLPTLVTSALELFFGLVTGLIEVLPQVIVSLLEALPQIVSTLLGMLPTLITTAVDLFFALVTGLLQMLPQLLTAIIGLLPSLVSTLISLIPTLIGAAVQVFAALVTGLLQNIGPLVNTILFEVIPGILGALAGAVPKLAEAGMNLIFGLVDGLWQVAGQVGQALLDIIGGAVDGFLGFLGIHSPSRLFMGFGRHIGEGLVIGMDRMQDTVERSALNLASAAADAAGSVDLGVAEGGLIHAQYRVADALTGPDSAYANGATYSTTYNDYSTSSEDKQAKLQRAQTVLEATVAANTRR